MDETKNKRNINHQSITDEVPRRRGRPAGKNRVPLSLQERRARNAQYERERRTETAEAMRELAEAAGCDPNISNADLLATVITQLQMSSQRDSSEDLNELRRLNNNLMLQNCDGIFDAEDQRENVSPL
ncbi:hypothetical protein K1T71_010785 [Dendrolimus kikuchii]|uniref:Uncharacterized protein n=1 Tax=Dendrolimus kikuchii TaxID=765133 RepID=A0ACC1CQ27_9NEOP|nr:hypothetical protein K1T71_010785 [Dendrolimus kikuchii]